MNAKGLFLYSKGNIINADDEWDSRQLIIDNLQNEELNDMFVQFVADRVNFGEPTDNILNKFADHMIHMMKKEGFTFETHGGNEWRYVGKSDCEHCEHKGNKIRFDGFPECEINSYSTVTNDGTKYCVYMAEKEAKQ